LPINETNIIIFNIKICYYYGKEIELYVNTIEELDESDYIDVEAFRSSNDSQINFKYLIGVARKYLSIPETTSPVERLYYFTIWFLTACIHENLCKYGH